MVDERVWRALAGQKGIGVAEIDSRTGRFIRLNRRYCEIAGYGMDEMLSRAFQDITHPEDLGADLGNMRRLLNGETDWFAMEKRYIRPDKSTRWVNLTVSPLWSPGEEPSSHIAFIEDITDRKTAEASLKASEEKFRIIADNTYDWEFWISPNGQFLYVSPSCERISGHTADEFIKDPSLRLEIVVPEDRPLMERHRAEHMSQRPGELEFRIRRPDGEIRWIGHACQPVFDSKGAFIGTRGSNRDITSHKKDEIELRKNEERYRSLFDSMLNGFALHEIILDSGGRPCDYRFLEANRAFQELTGLKLKDTLGKTVLEVMPGTERYWIETYGNVALTGTPVRFENYAGELGRHYEVYAYSPGKGLFAAVFEDITERKRAEKVIIDAKEALEVKVKERTAELEAANRSLGAEVSFRVKKERELKEALEALKRTNKSLEEFAYVASHDLQEPLRTITGFLQLLESRYRGRLDEDADTFISYSVKGAKRMYELINDLLSYSRVTTQGASFKPVDLNSALRHAMENLRGAIDESGAVIEAGGLPVINGDESQLSQLFQNLLGNAIKFRRPGASPVIRVTFRKERQAFSVADNGVGIAPEYSQKVFAVFQRLHGSEYPGTGIGLAICKKIVERHGGEIWVEGAEGGGAEFLFTLCPPKDGDTVSPF